jgi:IS5 family transposase
MWSMKQADLGLSLTKKRTRKRAYVDLVDKLVPWAELVELIATHRLQRGRNGCQTYEVE